MNIKKTSIALLCTISVSFAAFAQKENKILNPGFEEKEKAPKALGEFETVINWLTPKDCNPADIFIRKTKKPEIGIPENNYGSQEALEGDSYAGIIAYVERGDFTERTYLTTKFEKALLAGKPYCVKFNVSLADLSKFACNNLGVYVSSTAPKLKDIQEGKIKPQILQPSNAVLKDMEEWKTICAEFIADGTEKFITIGNFTPQAEVTVEKMKRPREFTQPQTRYAYYYIDDISVVATAHLNEPCYCEELPKDQGLKVVYTKNVGDDMNLSIEDQIGLKKIFFDSERNALTEQSKSQLNELAELINKKPLAKIEIIGHADNVETKKIMSDIGESRAQAVYDYLVEYGVAASRLSIKSLQDSSPHLEQETSAARAQNRRVEFKVIK
jgi:outer membrane protein OmpA-like peptidoglycan-associated protein